MSDYLRPHGLQHARLPCPLLSSRVCSNLFIESMMTSSHFILCRPPSPPAINLSQHQGLFRWVSSSQQVAKVLELQQSPSNKHSGLISFRTDLISLLSKGLSRVFSSTSLKASILWHSAFFMVQLSHPYMTPGKTIVLTTWTFVSKMTSLLFNRLSRLVIAFLPRSKYLLISWLQSPSVVILETKKIKSVTVSIFFPSTCHEVMGPGATILVFWMLSLKPAFSLTLSLSSRGSSVSLPFCHQGSVICISEVTGISPGNLDSSLSFIQPGILHDVFQI